MNKLTLTVKEAAECIGVSKDLIYKMVQEKRIPCLRIGKRLLFRRESIEEWMISQEKDYYSANSDKNDSY
ncbi:helix-turn-helix domain-containing protein [Priestia sp. D3YE.R1]|uniref:helix-turn-helix domain-containing protein n=1 Tax=Priestia sp. D3YE.R1 TaxID=3400416 RepID=UPI003BA04AC5